MRTEELLVKSFGLVFYGIFLIVMASLFPVAIWFCFDDALAGIAGVPELGSIAWYHVWAATIFVNMTLGRPVQNTSKDKK